VAAGADDDLTTQVATADGPLADRDARTALSDRDTTPRFVIVHGNTMRAAISYDETARGLIIVNDRSVSAPATQDDFLSAAGIHADTGLRTFIDRRSTSADPDLYTGCAGFARFAVHADAVLGVPATHLSAARRGPRGSATGAMHLPRTTGTRASACFYACILGEHLRGLRECDGSQRGGRHDCRSYIHIFLRSWIFK
jgi:hypothetical protein